MALTPGPDLHVWNLFQFWCVPKFCNAYSHDTDSLSIHDMTWAFSPRTATLFLPCATKTKKNMETLSSSASHTAEKLTWFT